MAERFDIRAILAGTTVIAEFEREAESALALRTQLESAGTVVLSIVKKKAQKAPRSFTVRLAPPQRFDIASWCREMATLLRAGMTVVEAVETMQIQAVAGTQQQLQQVLLHGLHEGKSLSLAMQDSGAFPQVLIAGVVASERTGRLAEALDDFIRYQMQLKALHKQTVSAAIYPAMVVSIGLGIVLFLLLYVLPRFAGVYNTFQGEVSFTTRAVLLISRTLSEHLVLILGVLGGLLLLGAGGFSSGQLQATLLKMARAFPPTRNALEDFNRSKLYQALGLTLKGGYPLLEAMNVCESLGLGELMNTRIRQARLAIERGQAASQALGEAGIADPVAMRLLRVGERGGQFVLVLQSLAERHADRFTTFIQRLTTFVEPVLLLVVALIVGGIVVMMYMPIFDIASGIH